MKKSLLTVLFIIFFFFFFLPQLYARTAIIIDPSTVSPLITASQATGNISACAGTASISPNIQQFNVSGNNLTENVTATAPMGFEISLTAGSGYGGGVTLNQSAGSLNSTMIYVRSAASAGVGNISGNVVLSSTGAANQNVAVFGIVNALPTVNAVGNQTVLNGTPTNAINFAGTGNVFSWINDTPGIGLAASGAGNIPSFTAINAGSSPVTATITATAISEGFAYITNSSNGTISIINVATNTVVSTISPPHDPFCVCISPDGSKAYVGCSGGTSTVTVINTITNAVISTIPVSSTGESTGITVSPNGAMLYVANYVTGTVSAVNTATGTVVAVIPVTANPYGIAISPDGSKVYVAFTYSNYISVINTATNTVTANITVGLAPQDIAISQDGSKVYVPVSNSNNIAIIDPITNSVTTVIPTGASPTVIALSPDGTRAYVATTSYSTYPNPSNVLVLNTSTNAVIATIAVGAASNGICVSPDGHFVYVTNAESNNVSVINASTNTVITTVKVGLSPISLGSFVTAGTGCTGVPTTFTITVKPNITTPTITASNTSGNISACAGTASASPNIQQFNVSGSNLTADIKATAPTGFELSLNDASGYGSNLTLTQSGGMVNNTIIYVRSSTTASAGNISGEVVLSSTGAANQSVAVSGTINAIPIVHMVNSQTLVNGATTSPINFTGTANTFSWVNDSPNIGLAATGKGDIPSFIVLNNTNSPIIATITVTPLNSSNTATPLNGTNTLTPLNGTDCNGTPVQFTITVNPTPIPATLTATGILSPLTTVYGTSSPSESFAISGASITSRISVNPPDGFEVSSDGITFNNSATINGTGSISSAQVYIRLASTTPVGNYGGNIIVSSSSATSINIAMPTSTVTPAPLTITADNKTKPYDAVNPILTATYNGFVNKDGPAQLSTLPDVATTAITQSAVGQYPITASGAGSHNYVFTYVPGILTIAPSLSLLSIPNTFTPNGDGVNDTWDIKYLEYYPRSSISIFNRWGQKMFSSIGYPIAWDGTYQGKVLPSGTYYYIIDPKSGQGVLSGWVAIIR